MERLRYKPNHFTDPSGKVKYFKPPDPIIPGLLNLGLKYTINRPRPGSGLGFFPLFSIGPARPDNGFPSGHTASAFVLLALAYLIPRSKPILRWSVGACFFSWGVHYPTDVFFGALIMITVEWVLWTGWFKKRIEDTDSLF